MQQITNDQINVIDWIYFTVAIVSFGCSLMTLYLIYSMKIRNGYLLLITSMTIFLLIYDINFFQRIIPGYTNCVVWNVFNILGGLSVSLWSNIISFIALFVIVKIRSMNIYQNYTKFFIFAVNPPFALSLVAIAVIRRPTDDDQPYKYCEFNHSSPLTRSVYALYYWGRIASILFNFGVFFYVSYCVHRMMRIGQNDEAINRFSAKSEDNIITNPMPRPSSLPEEPGRQTGSNITGAYPLYADTQSVAIAALVSRMKFYPLAQALSRSGAAWNEFDCYAYDSYPSNVISALCSPLCGILNFFIFLAMQPKAWQTFLHLFNISTATNSSITKATKTKSPPPNLPNHLPHTNPTLLSECDEEELHYYINEDPLRSSVFAAALSQEVRDSTMHVNL